VLISGSSSSAQLYGGSGNNIFIGGAGDTLMVGGKGNDQFYAGSSHDVMIGGGGANYFDCGPNGNGVILDFNAKNGDTKASNCKFVITVPTGVQTPP
jgi:Ca2+-binding RTX toxin-like protein